MNINKLNTALLVLTISFVNISFADNSNGIVRVKSNHSVSTTINKLVAALKSKGMTIFKRVHHSKSAANVGLELRNTELLVFGNPKIGTLLMQCNQSAALDLPMKALAYKDENGQVWLSYNDPQFIADRHDIKDCKKIIGKMTETLANFSKIATQ